MCSVLKELYTKVYDEEFNFSDFDSRVKLQKVVYLLENMGVNVGDYSFSWDKHGPYSISLDIDAKNCAKEPLQHDLKFSEKAERSIESIRIFLKTDTHYSTLDFMECLASLHYLVNVSRIKAYKVCDELVKRKTYLNNDSDNLKILKLIEKVKIS